MVDVSGVLIPAVSGSFNRACMVAQARSAWLASSLRLASYVALRPLLVMVLRIAINELVMSVALTSYSRQPRRMTSFALSTIAVFISGV